MSYFDDGAPLDAAVIDDLYQKIVKLDAANSAAQSLLSNLTLKYVPIVQAGKFSGIIVSDKTAKTFIIKFDNAFEGVPVLTLTPHYTNAIVDVDFTISAITTSDATIRYQSRSGSAKNFAVDWIAVYMKPQSI